MIFPDVTIKEWIRSYPALSVIKRKCCRCKKMMITSKPFIEKHWVGLQAEDCVCGNKGISVSTINPKSELMRDKFNKLFEEEI